MLTFTSLTSCSSAIRSSTGETAWHGPHHSAQKSTITLPSLSMTSVSNVSLVAMVATCSFLSSWTYDSVNDRCQTFVPASLRSKHVRFPTGQAGSSHDRARDPGALGAGGDLRAAPRAEP